MIFLILVCFFLLLVLLLVCLLLSFFSLSIIVEVSVFFSYYLIFVIKRGVGVSVFLSSINFLRISLFKGAVEAIVLVESVAATPSLSLSSLEAILLVINVSLFLLSLLESLIVVKELFNGGGWGIENLRIQQDKKYLHLFTLCLHMKRVLSVRIENELYTLVNKHDLSKSELVTSALYSYLNNGSSTIVNDKYTIHLEEEVEYLRSQVNGLMLARIPLLSRIKLKLLDK